MRLKGKTVLVTGASKGIGQAIAEGVAEEGAAGVVAHYHRDEDGARETAERARGYGAEAAVMQADVSDCAQIERLFRQVQERFGRLDALVNNAATTGWTSVFDVTEEEWDRIIDINLKGVFFCSVQAARMMRAQSGGDGSGEGGSGGGAIVNVSSNIAALGVKNLSVYATGKGGVHAMTRQLAVELAPHGIRVNTFAPGPTAVARNLEQDPDYRATWGRLVPAGRVADPAEMAGPAVFLASGDASYVTGQLFYADGGWSIAGQMPSEHMDAALSDAQQALKDTERTTAETDDQK
jgi:NAD(P)-dependent dehydrogenase (short-subunit alcohol dehydrogenase family)